MATSEMSKDKSKLLKLMRVQKRDGKTVPFDQEKITDAIGKAIFAVDGRRNEKLAGRISDKVVRLLKKDSSWKSGIVDIETIQDTVEDALIKEELSEIAKAYIIYRDQHAKIRDFESLMDSDKLVDDYLDRLDWRVKENSNMDYSLQGLNNYVSAAISSHYWLNRLYSKEVREAHEKGDFHIHDLQLLSAYCCGWDLKDILTKGFGGVSSKVESSPAKHFRAVLGQIVNFFYTLQGETAGAQAFSNFDTYLAPFVRYDGLDYKKVKQAMQEFMFNMNVPTRVGFQTPFTNITLDLSCPKMMKDENVIVGGEVKEEKYGDFQKEMDMINKALVEVYTEGDAKGRVFTFPIPTYNVTKEFDWDSPAALEVFEMTARYGIPYFSNFINSDMDPEDARSMCCRLRLDNRELRKRGGMFAANPLTGSIGVVTINMPRLGYVSNSKKEFFERLVRLMDLAKESLELKRKYLERFTKGGLYPYSRYYLSDIYKRFDQYWKNHFNTIGLNGMNEACINFLDGKGIATEEGHKFAQEVLDFMRDRLVEYQKETGNMFNLEATPAEGTAYRFARLDKKQYQKITVANEESCQKDKAAPYYTNSTHLPVGYTDDVFEALSLQDDLQTRYTGGTVLHCFIGEKINSAESVKALVKKIAENYHLPYFTISPTFSVCPVHGYMAGEHFFCPKCEEGVSPEDGASHKLFKEKTPCEVYSRIVGYIRPVQKWNDGKRAEYGDRTTYKMMEPC